MLRIKRRSNVRSGHACLTTVMMKGANYYNSTNMFFLPLYIQNIYSITTSEVWGIEYTHSSQNQIDFLTSYNKHTRANILEHEYIVKEEKHSKPPIVILRLT